MLGEDHKDGDKLTEGGGEQLSADMCGNDTKRDGELMMRMVTDASADKCPRADEQVDVVMPV